MKYTLKELVNKHIVDWKENVSSYTVKKGYVVIYGEFNPVEYIGRYGGDESWHVDFHNGDQREGHKSTDKIFEVYKQV